MKRSNLAYREAFFAGRLGIRGKILIYLAILAGFMLSLIWLFQSALLYDLYRGTRVSQLGTTADLLLQNIDHEDLEALADRLGEENDLGILLAEEDGTVRFAVGRTRYSPLENMSREETLRWASRAPEDGTALVESWSGGFPQREEYRKEDFDGNVPDSSSRSGIRSMMCVRKVTFQDGDTGYLLMHTRITPIPSTLSTSRRQLILSAIALVLATAMVGFTMAKSVSEPIIETNKAALDLSHSRYTRPPHSGGYREIAELNDTLVRAAEDLRKVEDLQRELIANISHDLRTPLTMIQGYAEAMRDIPDEATPENMQIIIDETGRLTSMVNEVLDFSRLRAGTLEMEISEFNLTELIRGICDRVSRMTGVEGYTVLFEDEGQEFSVLADSGRISQVIYNLIGNALTYTGQDRTVRISQRRKGALVQVRIEDSGEGIAPDELPYIWDRYFRSRENHRRAIIGSGLGLNICRSILEKHQAPFGVESEPGKGTAFWFELPLSDA